MLLRWLFIAILFYLVFRFFSRILGGNQQQKSQNNRFERRTNGSRHNSKKNLDMIEDAEYEDITEKEKK